MTFHPVIINLDGILLELFSSIDYKVVVPTLIADSRNKVSTIKPTKLHDFVKTFRVSEKTSCMTKLCVNKNTEKVCMLWTELKFIK